MRKYGRIDDNHTAIVETLRAIGCTVQSLASVGGGCPDLLVSRNGKLWLLEIKDGDKPPSRQTLTADQIIWHNNWNGVVHIVNNVETALQAVGAIVQ